MPTLASNLGCRRNISLARMAILVFIGNVCPNSFGQLTVVTGNGLRVPVDNSVFSPHGASATRDHPGDLSKGGYCSLGASLRADSYKPSDDLPRGVAVETVRHPPEYRFVAHDLIGTVRAFSVDKREREERRSFARTTPTVEVISWGPEGNTNTQTILYGSADIVGDKGIVAWYTSNVSSNGFVTVCVRYSHLVGLPRAVIDKYLKDYPSAVDPEFLARDWVDDDLDKWIQILRTAPAEDVLLQIVGRHLMNYERESGQNWGSLKLIGEQPTGAARSAKCEELAAKIEEWRRLRKPTPPGP